MWRYACNLQLGPEERRRVTDLLNAGYTGKWMTFVSTAEVETKWRIVFEATEAGLLGWKAKIATRDNLTRDGQHVICVYTCDYRDQTELVRVLTNLRELSFDGRLTYKEDAATDALVYRTSNRGPASLYLSRPKQLTFMRRRNPYTSEDSLLGWAATATPESLFRTNQDDYGLLDSET